jgi:hypothetical protein
MDSLFEKAAREKLRFPSSIGELSVEQIWDLPLTSKSDRPSLDVIARAAYAELKMVDEVSFVDTNPDPRKETLTLQLEIVKHVIAAKMDERNVAKRAADTAERKRKLLSALASKEDQELAGMSREQIETEIAKL